MDTVTTDDRKRLRIPVAQPGQVFSWKPNPDGTILLTPLKEDTEAKEVRLIKGADGLYHLPKGVKFDRKETRDYIRAERESR